MTGVMGGQKGQEDVSDLTLLQRVFQQWGSTRSGEKVFALRNFRLRNPFRAEGMEQGWMEVP